MENRAYDLLRTLLEEHGGIMVFEPEGHSIGGAWIINVAGMRRVFPYDNCTFPGIDELHVPKKGIQPKCFDDYERELIPGAWEKLLENMKIDWIGRLYDERWLEDICD